MNGIVMGFVILIYDKSHITGNPVETDAQTNSDNVYLNTPIQYKNLRSFVGSGKIFISHSQQPKP